MGRGHVALNKPMIFDGSDLKQLIMKEQALCGLLFFFFFFSFGLVLARIHLGFA